MLKFTQNTQNDDKVNQMYHCINRRWSQVLMINTQTHNNKNTTERELKMFVNQTEEEAV